MAFLIIAIYITMIGLISVIITIYDKIAAKKEKQRIPEKTLLTFAAIGGAAAMLATMKTIRHKTRKKKFMISLPVFMVIHIVLVTLYLVKG